MIHVIGLGVSESPLFSNEIIDVLSNANIIIGSARQILCVQENVTHKRFQELPKLNELDNIISKFDSVVILASGDPLFYGIGKWLINNYRTKKHDSKNELLFYPAVSSLQAACHEIGLSMQDCQTISLHGRALNTIRKHLNANNTLLILTDKKSQPHHLAQECLNAALDESIIHVCEQLGYANQKIRTFTALQLVENSDLEFDPLHVSVIQTKQQRSSFPSFPGFADELFITDLEKEKNFEPQTGKGMITKREVRLSILSFLEVQNQDVIWDVGAGCGSVSVELAYFNTSANIHAIEHNQERLDCLQANKEKFGVNNLFIHQANAPEVFPSLECPNKVFIGGSDGQLAQILEQVWRILPVGGILVASGVTENTKATLLDFMTSIESKTDTFSNSQAVQVAISKSKILGGQLMLRPNLPVTIIQMIKQ